MTYQEIEFETLAVSQDGQIVKRERLRTKQYLEELRDGVILEMIAIPGGAFLMGSAQGRGYDDERPLHRVKVATFSQPSRRACIVTPPQ